MRVVRDFPTQDAINYLFEYQPKNEEARSGFGSAANILGVFYTNETTVKGNDKIARRFFQIAADFGNVTGMLNLATCYRDGYGLDENPNLSFKYYMEAAKHGAYSALTEIAIFWRDGYGVPRDVSFALKIFRLSARHREPKAMYYLGIHYIEKNQEVRSLNIAARWFEKAIENGLHKLSFDVGLFYLKLYQKNCDERLGELAIRFLRLGEKHEIASAIFALGTCYQLGLYVDKDLNISRIFYKRAIDKGYEPTAKLNADGLAAL